MAQSDNFYSRFVVWTKIILPLIALGILSSLFLLSRAYDPSLGVNYSDQELQQLAEQEGINNPRYAGTTKDGISISLSASKARTGETKDQAIIANDIRAQIEMPDGENLEIVAKFGFVNSDSTLGEIADGILLDTSIGYTAIAEGFRFDLVAQRIESFGAVAASGPDGDISAGALVITFDPPTNDQEKGGYVLNFHKGVLLIYRPEIQDQEE